VVTQFPTQGVISDAHTSEPLTPQMPSPTNPNNEIVYTPPPNQFGPPQNDFILDSFSYVVRDRTTSSQSSPQVVLLRVVASPGDSAPTSSSSFPTVLEDTPYLTTLTATPSVTYPSDAITFSLIEGKRIFLEFSHIVRTQVRSVEHVCELFLQFYYS
jgi:hypothetical protein